MSVRKSFFVDDPFGGSLVIDVPDSLASDVVSSEAIAIAAERRGVPEIYPVHSLHYTFSDAESGFPNNLPTNTTYSTIKAIKSLFVI
jgi:hypothetical protein